MCSGTILTIFIFLTAYLPTFSIGGMTIIDGIKWGYVCLDNGNYTTNSTYKTNLNTLLPTLSQNVNEYGFYNASIGQSRNTVYANVLCRGDVELEMCHICINNATAVVVQVCPNQKQVFLWGSFCQIRYTNESIFGTMATYPWYYSSASANVTNPSEYLRDLKTLLDNLRGSVSNSLHKVAFGNITTFDFKLIYALVQCTPDISAEDCSTCLVAAPQSMNGFQAMRTGAEVHRPSCNINYALTNFINTTRVEELNSLSIAPLPPPPVLAQPLPLPPSSAWFYF